MSFNCASALLISLSVLVIILQDLIFPPGSIQSENYPSTYPLNYTGSWSLSAPENYPKITLVITDIAIECDCYDCGNDTCSANCDFDKCDVCEFDKIKVGQN